MEKVNAISDAEFNEKYTDWIECFGHAEIEPMSKETTDVFVRLNLMERDDFMMEKENCNFSFALAKKRADFIKLDINDSTLLLIVMLVNGIPGNIVMYLYYLKFYQLTHDGAPQLQ